MKDTVIEFPRTNSYKAFPPQQLERLGWLYIERMLSDQMMLDAYGTILTAEHEGLTASLYKYISTRDTDPQVKAMILDEMFYLVTDFLRSAYHFHGDDAWQEIEKMTAIEGLQQYIRITEQERYEHSKSSDE